MSKNRNYRNNYRNDKGENSQSYKQRSDRQGNKGSKTKRNGSLIFIKSSVVALTLILLTLMVSLIIKVGSNKSQSTTQSCSNKNLKLSAKISKIVQFRNSYVIVTTEVKDGKQEVVILNDCLNVVRKKVVKISNHQ